MKNDPSLKVTSWMRLGWHSSERTKHEAEIQRLIQDEGWEPYGDLNDDSWSSIILVKYEPRESTSDFMQELFLSLVERLERLEQKLDKE